MQLDSILKMSKNLNLVQCPKNGTLAITSCFILQLADWYFYKIWKLLTTNLDLLVHSRLYCVFFILFGSMSCSRKGLTQVEISNMLQELSDDDSIDDDIRDNITVSIIPPHPDEMTDENDIGENNIDDDENVNEFA